LTGFRLDGFTGFAGNDAPVMLTNADEPVEVAHTCPFFKPTIRTLSPPAKSQLCLSGRGKLVASQGVELIGGWLMTVIVSPRSVDR